MNYFNDALTTFLGLLKLRKLSSSMKNRCVPKVNEGLTSLERNDGEQLMTELHFLGELLL